MILQPDLFDAWLDPATPTDKAMALLRPPPDDLLEMIPIGRAVNKVANDSPEVQQPDGPGAPKPPPKRLSPRKTPEGQGGLFD